MAKQGHKDRLSAVDASFLHQEKGSAHMHIGALAIFEGPPPAPEEFVAHVESRLHLVPRYRQRLAVPRLEMGRPFWADDPAFNIDYHVRRTALPRPGTDVELRQLLGRIFSQRLDRSKPLWELWLVQGLEDNQFALISKTHHAVVDGVSGVDIATVLFDLSPVPVDPPAEIEPWTPAPEPSDAELVAEGVKAIVRTPFGLARQAAGALQRPGQTLERAREAAEGIGEVAWAGLNPAPHVPLNVPIGPHRRVRWARSRLSDFKTIKDALGGTVNDVVLAVVAGALGRWLRSRGLRTAGTELRALVPVSIRAMDERGTLGNRITAMRAPLPVYVDDPVERLRIVRGAMAGLKDSKQALGAEVISGLSDFAPPTLLAQASRLNFSTRLFNLIVTNVPGPQFPLYLLGREMQEIVPIAFLAENHALAIAIMSYNGELDFGLLADYDAVPDLESIGQYLEDSLAELLEAARAATADEERRVAAGGRRAAATDKRTTASTAKRGAGAAAKRRTPATSGSNGGQKRANGSRKRARATKAAPDA